MNPQDPNQGGMGQGDQPQVPPADPSVEQPAPEMPASEPSVPTEPVEQPGMPGGDTGMGDQGVPASQDEQNPVGEAPVA